MSGISSMMDLNTLERVQFDNAVVGTTGSNILDSDVPEEKMLIPLGLIISDTSGAANTATINKVEEDGTTSAIHGNFNLSADETRVVSVFDNGVILPRLEGGTNLEVVAGSDNVDVTLIWVHNVE